MLYHYQKVLLVKLFELYSFYSLRSALVLIFVLSFGFIDRQAFLVYTTFVVGGDIISIIGGYFGDKLLTRRISWVLGSLISIFGYSYAYFNFSAESIPFGLIFAGIGLGLCRCNSNVIINDYIQQEITKDERHNHNGIFHVVTIASLFLGFVINGIILQYGQPQQVFLFSSLASFISLISFASLEFNNIKNEIIETFSNNYQKILYVVGALSASFIFCKLLYKLQDYIQILILIFVGGSIVILFRMSKKYVPRDQQSILSLLLYVPFYLLYLSFEKQLDMGFSLFLFRNVDRIFFGFTIPSQTIVGVFSLAILFTTFIFYKKSVYAYFKHHSTLIYGLSFSLLYFSINYLGCVFETNGLVNIIYPMISLVFLGIADVLIVPRMYSLCRNVPENIKSTSASLMMLSHGSGFYIAGLLARFVAIDKNNTNLMHDVIVYKNGFLSLIVVNIFVLACVLIVVKLHYGSLLTRK